MPTVTSHNDLDHRDGVVEVNTIVTEVTIK